MKEIVYNKPESTILDVKEPAVIKARGKIYHSRGGERVWITDDESRLRVRKILYSSLMGILIVLTFFAGFIVGKVV